MRLIRKETSTPHYSKRYSTIDWNETLPPFAERCVGRNKRALVNQLLQAVLGCTEPVIIFGRGSTCPTPGFKKYAVVTRADVIIKTLRVSSIPEQFEKLE